MLQVPVGSLQVAETPFVKFACFLLPHFFYFLRTVFPAASQLNEHLEEAIQLITCYAKIEPSNN